MPDQKPQPLTREELLAIIEQAAREELTELDLSGKGITELPGEIGKLVNLRSLRLNDNELSELPESIGKLINLQDLFLVRNSLAALPNALANLSNLRRLYLLHNKLTTLPPMLFQLKLLWRLDVQSNELTFLPPEIGLLSGLGSLWLSNNKLQDLPSEIGRLKDLEELSAWNNSLTKLPSEFAQLTKLRDLRLGTEGSGNPLIQFPPEIKQFTELRLLGLSNCNLKSIPVWIEHLTQLQSLSLDYNQLTSLPTSLARLEKLETLELKGNPLNPALRSVYEGGISALRSYLRSLERGAEPLYESKLVFVGEGGVGKTTLLKALTGQEPREGEPTTHGVKIERQAMNIPHSEKQGVEIQLNAWDFGGQDVYRVTHQFFFSRRSIYLLVWEPRKGVQASQVEDWLKIIRLRVGDDARVIIVSTHCKTGERIARIDQPVLLRDFGSMIVGFHEVDSLVDDPATGEKVGIAELKTMIADAAKNLEQMGMPFNRDWRAARDELLAMKEPCIAYAKFADVCTRHGLDDIATKTLATLMHDLGYIVYYGDDERLKNDVVLQPEWLTKAIGFILEDRKTQEMDGILPDDRLKAVWWDHPFKGEQKYDPTLYPFFLRLMEKYDVSYRLESGTASLVAQHVPQVRPALPWLSDEEPTRGNRRIAMVCAMDDAPPGLVPWMIVRTHDYAYDLLGHRLHWQKGMFLRNTRHGEAMVELREREFHIYTQAVWPEFFMNVLRKTLQKLITDNWPGMEGRYYFAVPCKNRVDGKACDGRFRIDALKKFLEDGDETIRCQSCTKRQNIVELLYGFEEMGLREQLDELLKAKFAEQDSRIANYIFGVMQAIASESKEGPRLFTITPIDADWRKKLFATRYRVHLVCEAEGCQHPVREKDKGVYEFDATREWVTRVAPATRFIAGVLKTLAPVAAPAVNTFFGDKTTEVWGIDAELSLMKESVGVILPQTSTASSHSSEGVITELERSGILALHAKLRELDPNHEKLGLHRIPTYTGEYRWLCQKHYDAAQPKIPDRIG
jgi:Leucine-rich repeat (LRR) protein